MKMEIIRMHYTPKNDKCSYDKERFSFVAKVENLGEVSIDNEMLSEKLRKDMKTECLSLLKRKLGLIGKD